MAKKTLTGRVRELEKLNKELMDKVRQLSETVESKSPQPYSKVGQVGNRDQIAPVGVRSGWGNLHGNGVIWNDAMLAFPNNQTKPANAVSGYNRHSHGRFSGGALDINILEFVEYNVNWITDPNYNKDCQSYWIIDPAIVTELNTSNEQIERIGLLDLIFNPDTQKWGVTAYEIDVEKTYIVKRDSAGDIELDDNGNEKKSLLYNSDTTKTNVVWDTNAQAWQFFCIFDD